MEFTYSEHLEECIDCDKARRSKTTVERRQETLRYFNVPIVNSVSRNRPSLYCCFTIAQVEGQPLAFQHCPLVAKETVSVDEGEFRPESEGFWEWRADGMLTITRWSSTCGVSEGLKVVKHIQEHT